MPILAHVIRDERQGLLLVHNFGLVTFALFTFVLVLRPLAGLLERILPTLYRRFRDGPGMSIQGSCHGSLTPDPLCCVSLSSDGQFKFACRARLSIALDNKNLLRSLGERYWTLVLVSIGPEAIIHDQFRPTGGCGPIERKPIIVRMTERIACSCVTCPTCGIWVVLPFRVEVDPKEPKVTVVCAAPECAREFVFGWDEARTFELPHELFERRHFYRSELQSTST